MLANQFKKFPLLEVQGAQIVWDTRQELRSDLKKIVYLKSYLDVDAKKQLLQIPADEYVVDSNFSGHSSDKSKQFKVVESPEAELSKKAAEIFQNPSTSLRLLGVTGTNGKSSVVSLLGQLISKTETVVTIGTLGIQKFVDGKVVDSIDTGFTTPDGPSLQSFLFSLTQDNTTKIVLLELSSQAKDLGRLEGLSLDSVAFTNLSQDHLDHHGTMDEYAKVKARILVDHLKEDAKIICLRGADKRVFSAIDKTRLSELSLDDFSDISFSLDGISFEYGGATYSAPIIGSFNLENLRIVFESYIALLDRVPKQKDLSLLSQPRGRLDKVGTTKRPYVFIDYAHSPDAIEKAARALYEAKNDKSQKLWTLFGCGGDRDSSKRPKMAQAAESNSDFVVVTSDNPRTEDPQKIVCDVVAGLKHPERALVVVDRRQAIEHALVKMASNDILLIAGKGHEEYQIVGNEKLPFSDYAMVLETIPKI